MAVLKIGFLGALALLSAVAIFIGAVTLLTSLKLGAITLSYTASGREITETISRATDAARFWKTMTAMGFAPAALGGLCLWYAVRKLRNLGA